MFSHSTEILHVPFVDSPILFGSSYSMYNNNNNNKNNNDNDNDNDYDNSNKNNNKFSEVRCT